MSEQRGKVYLVGAGLGNIGYLTVRAQQLLAQAEVLVYDALVDSQLLQLVPADCLKMDVGKRGGQPSTPQSEIDTLLVEQCLSGRQVVRLKSGDPFIFGRTTSEINALTAAGANFEVVPGISSALAAPLLAGIPLTDAVLSRNFAVLTAHDPDALNWEALAGIETLVILMGGRNLNEIVVKLQRHGRSLHTPIAIIRWAGSPQQQVWTGELGTICEQVAGVSLSPVVIVIGEVVKLRDYLQPQGMTIRTNALDLKPLSDKTILVTRSLGQSTEFRHLLEQQGATVMEMPTLEIAPPSNWEPLDRAIANLQTFNWLILTSSNGVDYFFQRLFAQVKDARALAGVKIAVVGKKTAASLKKQGIEADFIPPNFVADALVEHFPEPPAGKKVLFPRVETGGREVLVKELTAKGAEVVEVPAYQSRCPDVNILRSSDGNSPSVLAALQSKTLDVITFASSKTVKNFCQLIAACGGVSLDGVCIASIGPQTSETCQQLLGRVDVESQEYTLEGLTQAIAQWAISEKSRLFS